MRSSSLLLMSLVFPYLLGKHSLAFLVSSSWNKQQTLQTVRSGRFPPFLVRTTTSVPMSSSTTRFMTEMVDADHNRGTPIIASKLQFHDSNAALDQQRRSHFERFQSIVGSLSQLEDENQISLIWHSDREVNHAGVIPINSLLFQVERTIASESASTDTVETFDVIAVVPSSSKVTIRQLEEHFQVDNWDERIPNPQVKCSLVPQDEVETRCGFPPQSVPPLGHVPHTLRILVDLSLCSQLPPKKSILVGGGGHNRIGCLLDAQLLLMLEGTEVASLTKESLRIQQELQHEQHPQQQSSTFDAERSADTLPASLMEFKMV